MTDIPVQVGVTENELMSLSEDEWWEVVDGELVKTDMGAAGYFHVIVIDNFYDILKPFVRANKLGRVQTDGLTFILHVTDKRVRVSRIPDFSFVRRGRIPKNFNWSRPFPGAPDLAVEVVSPTEKAEETMEKINDYLRYGSEQAWVVYPSSQEVHVFRRDDPKTVHICHSEDTIDTSALFPGLELKVQSLFVIDED